MTDQALGVRIESRGPQEAADPYLCRWAEFYFLAQMSHMHLRCLETGEKPELIEGFVVGDDGELRNCLVVQKGSITNVPFLDDSGREGRVNLGRATGLVLEGELEDVIVIPGGGNGFVTGRAIDERFLSEIDAYLSEFYVNNPPGQGDYATGMYIKRAYERILRAKESLGVSSNRELLNLLKTELISNYSGGHDDSNC